VSEQRLRTAVIQCHRPSVPGSRMLLDALVDTGGESRLERWLLALARRAGLPRPALQRTVREGGRMIARVDALFPGGLVVEVEGHGTHSSRRQRQADEERRTALMRRGFTVLVFTYVDVRERPAWVAEQIRAMLARAA
jgi:hypothetical protein